MPNILETVEGLKGLLPILRTILLVIILLVVFNIILKVIKVNWLSIFYTRNKKIYKLGIVQELECLILK